MHPRDCAGCRRPHDYCLCRYLDPIETAVEVVVVQHLREAKRRIGTAWLAHRALAGSSLHVGDVPAEILGPDTYLLFPSPGAEDLATKRFERPPRLVVPDGTWTQARKLVRTTALAGLPSVRFDPTAGSRFPLRQPPRPDLRSTLESIVEALVAIEGRPERFTRLLEAIDAMVAVRDARRETNDAGPRRRTRRRTRRRVPSLAAGEAQPGTQADRGPTIGLRAPGQERVEPGSVGEDPGLGIEPGDDGGDR